MRSPFPSPVATFPPPPVLAGASASLQLPIRLLRNPAARHGDRVGAHHVLPLPLPRFPRPFHPASPHAPLSSQVRARAFSSPSAFLGILLHGTEIVWELTMFFLSLSIAFLILSISTPPPRTPLSSQVRARAFSSPSTFLGILLRGTEIMWELTSSSPSPTTSSSASTSATCRPILLFPAAPSFSRLALSTPIVPLSSPRAPPSPSPQVRARAFSSPSAFLGILLRGTEIVWELTMFFLSLSYDKLVGLDERNVPTRAAQLRRLLCRLGPSFIKSGQVLANRPDIIREDYMNELCILQDDVPAFPTQVRQPSLRRPQVKRCCKAACRHACKLLCCPP
ncbi:unnamed protein product [Closterium sp. NIES-53]